MIDVSKFKGIKVSIASPEKIRSWSYGEVRNLKQLIIVRLNPNAMAYSVKKSLDQLKIMNVAVVKYKRLRYKNIVCDRCGVEVTLSKVRRERMGHIELAAPCSHIWFLKVYHQKWALS